MNPLKRAIEPGMKKAWLFRLIILLLLVLFAEVVGYAGLRILNRRYPMDPIAEITHDQVESFLKKIYDPDLGWVVDHTRHTLNSLGARSLHEYPDLSLSISAYGDSYTFGSGVPVEDAWTSLLEETSGVAVLNFGVQGYGTDQALLRLERQHEQIPTPTVLLCVLTENINRCHNVYQGFYRPRFGPPKPRFVMVDGELTIYNPFHTADEVRDILLEHPQRLIQIGKKHDYWYQQLEFLGRPWRIAFPYSLQMAVRIPYCLNRLRLGLKDHGPHIPLYEEGSQSLRLMTAILRRFDDFANERGFKGFVIVFPTIRDARMMQRTGKVGHQPLLDRMTAENIPYLDLVNIIAEQQDLSAIYQNAEDHFTRAGGYIVASRITDFLREHDALPGKVADAGE